MKKLAAYATGFVLSVALTVLPLVALWMRDEGSAPLSPAMLYAAFVLFALIQLCVQLSFFLHMDEEERAIDLRMCGRCQAVLNHRQNGYVAR